MPRAYECPFFTWEKDQAVNCEGGKVKFKDDTAKQEYVEQFCANPCGWRGCSVAKNLNDYYERSLKA